MPSSLSIQVKHAFILLTDFPLDFRNQNISAVQ